MNQEILNNFIVKPFNADLIMADITDKKGRTRQTLWEGCADANPKTCCQTIHDCQKSSTFAL